MDLAKASERRNVGSKKTIWSCRMDRNASKWRKPDSAPVAMEWDGCGGGWQLARVGYAYVCGQTL